MVVIAYDAFQHYGYREAETLGTLTAGMGKRRGDTPLIAFIPQGFNEYVQSDECSTLRATNGADLGGGSEAIIVDDSGTQIRRLTPTECGRLQGFPDWWVNGVEGSDTAKYKMWGNGVALNCVYFVMSGIAEELKRGD